jgi:hypothetical protein
MSLVLNEDGTEKVSQVKGSSLLASSLSGEQALHAPA